MNEKVKTKNNLKYKTVTGTGQLVGFIVLTQVLPHLIKHTASVLFAFQEKILESDPSLISWTIVLGTYLMLLIAVLSFPLVPLVLLLRGVECDWLPKKEPYLLKIVKVWSVLLGCLMAINLISFLTIVYKNIS